MHVARSFLAAVLIATLLRSSAGAAQGADRPLADFRGRCIFDGGAQHLDLRAPYEQSKEGLFAHARAHGWNAQLDDPDYVRSDRAAACPAAMLDDMAWVARPEDPRFYDVFAYRALAQTLERNGRLDDALDLLERAGRSIDGLKSERLDAMHASFLAEWAARLAFHSGRWELALQHAEGWRATSGCGNCASGERIRQTALRARALQALGRCAEVEELARSTVDSGWTSDSSLVELWIDCELSAGRAHSAEEALERIVAQVPESAHATCRSALEDWSVAHARGERPIEDLARLASSHPELALPLVLSMDAAHVERALSAFDVVDGRLRHHALADLLAEVGCPSVEVALARARAALDDDVEETRVKYVQQAFDTGRKRWSALSPSGL